MSNNETRKEVNSISIESSHDAFLRFVNSLLEAGVIDSSHPFHEGAFATISDDSIDQRHVVIRDYNFERRSLIFHTDYRSPKIKQLKTNSTCSFLFYSKKDRIQLRFKCIAHVHHQDRLSLAMFKKTTSSQQDCYKYPSIPSASIDTASKEIALIQNKQVLDDPYSNFAVCVCNFSELDLLYLNHVHHIRINYSWDKHNQLNSSYVVA